MTRPAPDNGASGECASGLVNRRLVLLAVGGIVVTVATGFTRDPSHAGRVAPRRVTGRAAGQDPAAAAATSEALATDMREATAAIGGAVTTAEEADARSREPARRASQSTPWTTTRPGRSR